MRFDGFLWFVVHSSRGLFRLPALTIRVGEGQWPVVVIALPRPLSRITEGGSEIMLGGNSFVFVLAELPKASRSGEGDSWVLRKQYSGVSGDSNAPSRSSPKSW